MPYATRVREFLEELATRSGGKIHLRIIDPQPFSDDEDRAAEFGLQPLHGGGGDALYFGLAGTNSTDGRSSIPSFQADREEFLEYDVAKLINDLGTPKKPVIGLMSSLGLQGQFNPMTGQMGEPWPILTQLQDLFTMRTLTTDVDHIDKDVDVLMLVHPKAVAAEDPVRHRSVRDARRQSAAVRRSECRRGHQRSGSVESARRRDGQSFFGSQAAAGGLGRRLRSDQGHRRPGARARSAHQHAGAAGASHRHPRPGATTT